MTLLQPDVGKTVRYAQGQQKRHCDKHARQRAVSMGDDVFVRNYSNPKLPWIAGKVVESTGLISAKVALDDGKILRHQDQISSSNTKEPNTISPEENEGSKTSAVETTATETQTRRYPMRERRRPRKLDILILRRYIDIDIDINLWTLFLKKKREKKGTIKLRGEICSIVNIVYVN